MIFAMGITMLKLDRAKAKWRVKLQRAFSDQRLSPLHSTTILILIFHPQMSIVAQQLVNGYSLSFH